MGESISFESKAGQKNPFLEMRDKYKESASELQRKVAEVQAAKYEMAPLYQLMRRTGDNSKITNALNEFLGALDHQASFGNPETPLSKARTDELIKFFKEKTEELRPSDKRGW